jgi:acetyl-CoA synthetase
MLVSQNRDNYAYLHEHFQWLVPEKFNIAHVCCGRWAQGPDAKNKIAIKAMETPASGLFHSYFDLQQQASRLSNVLAVMGVRRGDRVAIVMPQRFETAVAYMAVLQMGAVAMPLSMLFGPEALEYRLHDSEAVLAICDESSIASLNAVRENCPLLGSVIGVGAAAAQADVDYADALSRVTPEFALVETLADEAAILIYTSGTTGNPKGALIPHRTLIGNLTGFVCSQNWFGFDGQGNAATEAVFWSPADWAWTGGLMDALLPTLYFGRPIVAFNGRFSPQMAMELMRDGGVTHTFLFPTALKAMLKAYPGTATQTVREQFQLQLQAIMTAGEAAGDAVFEYCQNQLGVTVNEMFGQTEINYIVGNCAAQWPARPGSMGKGYPGHRVAVIDDEGAECPAGVAGDVALNRFDGHGHPDPIFFLGYWKNEASTGAKYTGDWCRTGDLATRDVDGYLWYQGRSDDIFKAAGYRIGPGEIENCLVKHPAVANAAVVPKPDKARGAVVKAYVVIAPDLLLSRPINMPAREVFDEKLIAQLQAHVKDKLAPYEYPKEIEFVDALPMTTTGKVQRRVLRLQEEERARLRG